MIQSAPMIQKLISFLKRDIWRVRAAEIPGLRGKFFRTLRIFLLSLSRFTNNQCAFRASALTFYSLLSIVPVLAMSFGIAKGFGLDKLLREKLIEGVQGQQEILTRLISFAETLLENTRGGVVAGIGVAILLWSVIQVLGNVESAFNGIWGIKRGRSMGRKFTDYLSLMLVAPVLYVLATSATVFAASQIEAISQKIALLGALVPLINLGLKALPLFVFAGLLTYIYIAMPNGKVQFKSALLGGFVAGVLYLLVQWVYIRFQIGASRAGAIYGSFAALPLFLVWLQLSWRIVLYGAELAFSHQNELTFEFEEDCLSVSYTTKKLFSLRLVQLCVSRFSEGSEPLSAEDMAARLKMPIRLARDLLFSLVESKILTMAQGEGDKERLYQPGRDIGSLSVAEVVSLMEDSGTGLVPIEDSEELKKIRQTLSVFDKSLKKSPENFLLKNA